MKELEERIRKIRMLVMDVDGVMTDGGIILGTDGMELKRFHVHDGMAIALARAAGLRIGILTGRSSEVVRRRAEELHVEEVRQGILRKEEAYDAILEKYGLKDEEIAYIGDDLLDIPVLKRAGLSVCVANGTEEARSAARYITEKRGGDGAVREVVDMLLKEMGKKEEAIDSLLGPSSRG